MNRRLVNGPGRIVVLFALSGLLTVVGLGLSSAPTSAQDGRLRLLRQTAYVPAEGVYSAELEWTGPFSADLAVSVLIHTPISAESEVTSSPTGVLNRTTPTPITSLPRNNRTIQISIPIRAISTGDDRILLREPGVYPVSIEVRGAEGTVASLRSNLIRLPSDIAEIEPLPVAFILGVSAAEDITIADATGLLALRPDLPITVQLDDGALTQLSTDQELADSFRAALGDRRVLVSPSYDLDPSSVAEISQDQLFITSVQRTADELRELQLSSVAGTVALDSELTQAGVELLGKAGIVAVVRSGAGSGSAGEISTSINVIKVLEADATLTNELAAGPLAIENTHRLIAILAIRQSRESSPVLLGGNSVTSLGLEAADTFLEAVGSSGLTQPISLSQSGELASRLPLRPAERPTQDLAAIKPELEGVIGLLKTYSDFHVSGGLHPITAENNILTSLSIDRNPDDRLRALRAARAGLEEALRPIDLPEGQAITLAATRSIIPLTIANNADGPRQVQLRFTSRKVQVKEQNSLYVLEPGVNTIEINVEARSLGLSPLEVEVLSPDGTMQLASTRFQIRSTAVPGLGYALSGAALGVLVIWWITNARNRRKRERELASGPGPQTPSGSPNDRDRRPTSEPQPVSQSTSGQRSGKSDQSDGSTPGSVLT